MRKVVMANKAIQKVNRKKPGRTLKEKRAAKNAKNAAKSASLIPPTGH
ncbi:MAG TPA: hypothetical protein VFB84_22090 [Micromonosporaceae bacterium]|nr:hypothetical protein [Micromonosporaceae bacterium]